MDSRFGLIVILLILDAVSVWSTDGKRSGNHGSSKKKKNSTRLSAGIQNNPFLQQFPTITLPSLGGNPFLQFNRSQSQLDVMPNIFQPQENQSSSAAVFNNGNPFLNFGITFGTPVTQVPFRLPFYTPAPNTSAPETSPISHGSFPNKIGPPTPEPSLFDLIPIKVGPAQTKSELKCEEYAREIVGTTNITSLVGTSSDVIKVDNVCRNTNRLVIGGTEARPGEFPHMVALGKQNSDGTFTLICGGTLISYTWVLSAAHCTYGPNGSPSDARIGFHKLTDQQPGVIVVIKRMIRHPEFIPPAMYADIALIELVSAVTFSTLIRPACLYQQYDTVPANGWISGWGVTTFAGELTDKLQKAQLDLVDNLACTIRHSSSKEAPHGITPSMICAGDPRGGWTKDACQGDSGGPLQVIHPKNLCLFQVIGITSFGEGCATNVPGVYTRVSHYLPWIENIVWP